MKKLLIVATTLCTFYACRDKKVVEPAPEEYFSFTVDGIDYNYPQVRGFSGSGKWQSLDAYNLGATNYVIKARDHYATGGVDGSFSFSFPGSTIPDRDTILLDGGLNNVYIRNFLISDRAFVLQAPLKGKIIFSERSVTKLSGIFEFQGYLKTGPGEYNTDSVLTITNGKFSIKPRD